ncbi:MULTISPECIES: SulP family inorganic anion transporter [Methylobacterium]|jgi:SulP family sulfate permease|uniref:SulP family inorganic anion transporter n=1 Tax=Methylobacterium ajmalii TaxID=2738439 RepID=A0ABU9ZWJ8_9HYPH|nr:MULTISPECIES: SulP family inorganic anion transporter [Methylobacterium]MBK3396441.1 SulP family inorganic anion transporter [Methylobacterium ajmalii]MBK3407781.1 SulP family inorganic anion transporter [Methylobacterium ajmalii]MBK3423418.1 SulP family inorganic anion transporter [Methylobacterium ajmalii]MBZ6412457.1 SulP family inorganic anion transporter [Methylobacterium sp.]SFE27286.1 sulfate permease, SulP family [Methylobacterium sp. yr596]
MNLVRLRREWAPDVTREILAGTVVALALIPEAIAFSIIAGVDPKVGLYASFCIAVVTAIAGGRPAMISAATGAMALVMTTLVKDHGLGYLFAATILTGLIQLAAGALRLGNLMRFVSRSVVTGFVNALAILIFMAQMPELLGRGPIVYAMTAAGLALIYGLPYLTKAVPSALVTIVLLTALSMSLGLGIRTVGDMGALPSELPSFALPQVPLTLETLRIILPYALTLSMVGLLESLMTAAIVDERTDTTSNKNRECAGQGLANVTAGLFGGMAGCAMIGQSVINVSSGGRGRLSTLWAGAFLLFLIVVLGPYVAQIPMAALVAVMIMVSINTFQWRSIRTLLTHPTTSSIVMLGTVAVVVATHDLAKGVLFGVVLSGLFFAHKVTRFFAITSSREGAVRTYRVTGQIFFATAEAFHAGFDFREDDLGRVAIDLTQAHFWDLTAVNALDRVVLKFRHHDVPVEIVGLNAASATLVEKLGTHDKPGAALASGH